MATLASPQIKAITSAIVNKVGLSSAVLSGIVPDSRHLDNGGYHCSVEDLKRFGNGGDYSNTRADDKNFNVKYGAAFDVTMSTADMRRAYKRIYSVWKDRGDPRRRYFNAVNCWDGSGDAVRLDFKRNTAGHATDDHRWHVHGDLPRRYVLDPKAARAWISVFAGESRAAWSAREETEKAPAKAPVKVASAVRPAVAPAPKVFQPGSRPLVYAPGRVVLKGADVAYVQRFIGAAKAGPTSGSFGAQTRAGVIWYQRMRGLQADGIVGPLTWRAMGVKAN